MKAIIVSLVVATIFIFSEKNKLTGRWQSPPSPTGAVTGVVFKADSSFEGYVNKKPFVSGRYILDDSVFSLVDNGCEGKWAKYKLVFFSNDDSLRFTPIDDVCLDRKNGMQRLVLGRVK